MSAQPEVIQNQLSFYISEFSNKTDNQPKKLQISWENFLVRIKKHTIRSDKDGNAFAPATFNGTRSKEYAQEIFLLVLDFDDGTTLEEITAKCKTLGYSFATHTTHSHTLEKHKFRVVFPLLVPIAANVYPLLWHWIAKHFPTIDPQAKDTSRMFYYPAIKTKNSPFCAESFDGKFLDWRELKDLVALAEEPPKQQYQQTSDNYTTNNKAKSAYVQAALDGEVSKVRSATKGERNGTLNKAAFALAQQLHTNLIDETTIKSELENAGLSIGLSRDETRRTIESGIAAGRKQPRIIPEKEFSSSYQKSTTYQSSHSKTEKEAPTTGNKPKRKLGKSGSTLMQQVFDPLTYVVDGIIPEGVSLLVAPSKMGKSAFALGVSASVAVQGKALGAIPVETRPVLYCALEDGERRLQDRLNKLLMGEELGENFFYETHMPALFDGGLELLEEWLQEHPRAFVVIDVLQKVRPAGLPGESVYDRDYRSIAGLKELAEKYRASILILHHTRKAEAADFVNSINGSMGLSGAVDTILLLSRDRCKGDAKLSISGREVEERELALEFKFPSWKLLGDADEVSHSLIRRTIISILQKAGCPLTPKDVFEEYQLQDQQIKYNTIKQRLYQMSKDGQVKVLTTGKYMLPTHTTHTDNQSNYDNHHNHHNRHNREADSSQNTTTCSYSEPNKTEGFINETSIEPGYEGYASTEETPQSGNAQQQEVQREGYAGYDGYADMEGIPQEIPTDWTLLLQIVRAALADPNLEKVNEQLHKDCLAYQNFKMRMHPSQRLVETVRGTVSELVKLGYYVPTQERTMII